MSFLTLYQPFCKSEKNKRYPFCNRRILDSLTDPPVSSDWEEYPHLRTTRKGYRVDLKFFLVYPFGDPFLRNELSSDTDWDLSSNKDSIGQKQPMSDAYFGSPSFVSQKLSTSGTTNLPRYTSFITPRISLNRITLVSRSLSPVTSSTFITTLPSLYGTPVLTSGMMKTGPQVLFSEPVVIVPKNSVPCPAYCGPPPIPRSHRWLPTNSLSQNNKTEKKPITRN